MLLEIVATILGVVAIFVSIGAFCLQKKQGERIAMSVIGTVDQIYRHIRGPDPAVVLGDSDIDLRAICSPSRMKANERTELSLEGSFASAPSDPVSITCEVERPTDKRGRVVKDRIHREASVKGRSLGLQVVYPSDEFHGSTSEPGRYHVRWRVAACYVAVKRGTGKEWREEVERTVEDSFAVMP